MSYEIVNTFPHDILFSEDEGLVSLYQPTHRHGPDNQQDPIRFKNLTKKIEESLSEKYDKETVEKRMKPFNDLALDHEFWQNAGKGLAMFTTADKAIIYRLQRTVDELAIVADSFHIKPLIRVFQSADRYHLLGLDQKEFSLFEGTRYDLAQVKLDPSIENTVQEALGAAYDYKEKLITVGSSGGPGGHAVVHGLNSKKEVIDDQTEKFFRIVDKEVADRYSGPTGLPLHLVALDQYHTPFQELSKNEHLSEAGVRLDYASMNLEELKEKAWEVIEPLYIQRTKDLVENFENARAKDEGSDDIAQVSRAAVEGRVSRVLIEADRLHPGQIDLETGELNDVDADLNDPEIDDVLDDIAELVFKQKGEVVVVPKERMPSDTGVAAIYRY